MKHIEVDHTSPDGELKHTSIVSEVITQQLSSLGPENQTVVNLTSHDQFATITFESRLVFRKNPWKC